MTTGKTIALTRLTFVSKVMSLIFNMLSSLVTAFLPRSKHLLISWLKPPSAVILEPKKIKSHSFHCFLIYLPWRYRTGCYDLEAGNKPTDIWFKWSSQGMCLSGDDRWAEIWLKWGRGICQYLGEELSRQGGKQVQRLWGRCGWEIAKKPVCLEHGEQGRERWGRRPER